MSKHAADPFTDHHVEHALILATRLGRIQFADANARKWLKYIFGRTAPITHLPAQLCQWLSANGNNPVALSLGTNSSAARVLFRKKALTASTVIVALELIRGKAVKEKWRRHRGLTAREQEVLFWLARGKTNADIGAILGVAPATVGKHLERIYPKLGVENRTSASTFAASYEGDFNSVKINYARSDMLQDMHSE